MKVYKGRGIGDIYYSLIKDITNEGVEITTRGQRCLELPEPVTLVYDQPGYCWMNIPGRKFNPFFALAEVPWILSGNGNADWISYFNKNMLTYLDEGSRNFHGSYGLRMRKWWCGSSPVVDQIQQVVRKLQEDPFSRQAVISLWDPVRDNLFKSKDIPCNNLVYYRLRNGVLDQTVVIRSNDVIWGTPHNAIQFSHVHAFVAGILQVKMGTLTYVVQNLHYYLDLYNPTLGHVLNAACSGETLQAEKTDSFGPGSLTDLEVCVGQVEQMLDIVFHRSTPDAKKLIGLRSMRFLHSGYWGFVIPQVIWAYIVVKEGLLVSADEIDALALILKGLPSPLPALIQEFWADSSNPFAKEIVYAMRQP